MNIVAHCLRGLIAFIACLVLWQPSVHAQSEVNNVPAASSTQQAANGKCGGTTDFFSGIETATARFEGMTNVKATLIQGGSDTAAKIVPFAKGIAGGLAVLSLLWGIARAMWAGQGTPITATLDVLVPSLIVAFLLTSYSGTIAVLQEGTDMISSVLPGPWTAVVKLFSAMFGAIVAGFQHTIAAIDCVGVFSSGFLWAVGVTAVSCVLLIYATICVVDGLIEIVRVLFLGPFLAAVGIAVGPIFVAFGVSGWTRSWIGPWLGFTIQALLLSFFSSLVLLLMATPFTAVSDAMRFGDVRSSSGVVMLDCLMIVGLSLLASRLFAQIPQIVSTLFPGNLGMVVGNGARQPRPPKDDGKGSGRSQGSGGIVRQVLQGAASGIIRSSPTLSLAVRGATALTNAAFRFGGGSRAGASAAGRGAAPAPRPFQAVSSSRQQRAADRLARRRRPNGT